MNKLSKIIRVIEGKIIKQVRYISTDKYMRLYVRYLKGLGVIIKENPKYIDNSCYFDGVDYSKIEIGKDVVISRDVMLLTHDYSISRGLQSIGKLPDREMRVIKEIKIGNNSFIGAKASLLPGTIIGENVIVGAGSVVKGIVPDNSIVVGNPAKVIANTQEWAEKQFKLMFEEMES